MSAERKPAEHSSVPQGWLNRAHFYWMMIWGLAVTVILTVVQVIGHQISPTSRTFQRNASMWGRAILGGGGIRAEVDDQSGLDASKPYVFVSNHQNLIDILALAAAVPYPFGFVAKAELARVPFLGVAIRQSTSIFLDRSDRRKAVESLRKAGERIRDGNSVLVYAEGSRSYAPNLMPFKKGAFMIAIEAGVPIVPVVVVDAYRLMHDKRRVSRPGRVRVIIRPPIDLTGARRSDVGDLIERVRSEMDEPLRLHRQEVLSSPRSSD
jgi:1-acyl-sn-glycerol-3-phosphate acyltransferase